MDKEPWKDSWWLEALVFLAFVGAFCLLIYVGSAGWDN